MCARGVCTRGTESPSSSATCRVHGGRGGDGLKGRKGRGCVGGEGVKGRGGNGGTGWISKKARKWNGNANKNEGKKGENRGIERTKTSDKESIVCK